MLLRLLSLVLLSLLPLSLLAGNYDPAQRQDVSEFIDEMVSDQEMDRTHLEALFKAVNKRQDILDLIARPAERVLVWHEYKRRGIWCSSRNYYFHYRHRNLLWW